MSWLEVHIFGSSSMGEGIVLKLPDTRFAVVDCCYRGDIRETKSNPMIAFLSSRKVKNLAFVCLTHPHEDHYFGLSQILRSTPAERFLRSAAMTPARLMSILKWEQMEALRYGDTARQRVIRELLTIEKTWKALSKGRAQERVCANLTVYPLKASRRRSFEIIGLAPCNNEMDAYEGELSKCIGTDVVEITGKSFELPHNRISVGLLIKCEYFNVVLGGDMDKNNWRFALETFQQSEIGSHLVKISHHGSKTGDCEGLWEALSSGREKPIGVVTGYSKSKLPKKEMLEKFSKFTSELTCTHHDSIAADTVSPLVVRRATASDRAIAELFSLDSRESDLKTAFDGLHKIELPKYGRCSYYFNNVGDLEKSELDEACTKIC